MQVVGSNPSPPTFPSSKVIPYKQTQPDKLTHWPWPVVLCQTGLTTRTEEYLGKLEIALVMGRLALNGKSCFEQGGVVGEILTLSNSVGLVAQRWSTSEGESWTKRM